MLKDIEIRDIYEKLSDENKDFIEGIMRTAIFCQENSRKREEQLRAELMRKYSKPVTLNRD